MTPVASQDYILQMFEDIILDASPVAPFRLGTTLPGNLRTGTSTDWGAPTSGTAYKDDFASLGASLLPFNTDQGDKGRTIDLNWIVDGASDAGTYNGVILTAASGAGAAVLLATLFPSTITVASGDILRITLSVVCSLDGTVSLQADTVLL